MSGRFGKPDDDMTKKNKESDRKPPEAPQPLPDDDEEDGDIATPKHDRDDEAGL